MSEQEELRAPGLVIETPPCSLCGRPTEATPDSTFDCHPCGWTWSGDIEEPGERIDPETSLCGEERQPHLSMVGLPEWHRTELYRCVLPKGHDGSADLQDRYHRAVSVRGDDTFEWL